MKLYFAGQMGFRPDVLKKLGITKKLYSFHNEKKEAIKWGSKNLMLDSGAYSAFTQGIKINMKELNQYIQKLKPEYAIQLDVIGEEEATWKNYVKQKTEVDVMPVIHYMASPKHIKRVLKEGYVCFGGTVGCSPATKMQWLDYLFSYPEARNVKIHGLGVMSKIMLCRYPFYSTDSTTALKVFRYPESIKLDRFRQKTKTREELLTHTIKQQLDLETYVTKLWKKRGIKW